MLVMGGGRVAQPFEQVNIYSVSTKKLDNGYFQSCVYDCAAQLPHGQ
jgi:hypothetical protein